MGDENVSIDGTGALDFVGGLVDTGVNIWQNKVNREWASEEAQHNRDFQVQMYERQLDDSVAWRTHQEQYNSPKAQMERYREAGINPMYMVSGGNAGNSVVTPFTAGGSGFGSSTPSPSQHRLSFAEAFRMRNEARLTDANVKLLESEAREHNANAQRTEDDLPKTGFYREVWKKYANTTFHDGNSMVWSHAEFMRTAHEYEWEMQDLSFAEAKKRFIHSDAVRSFEISLNEHKRSLFEHELSQAKSAADLFGVSARWAVANQWINAGSQILGAASGLLKAFKAPPSVTNTTHNYGSNERHIYGDYQYHPVNTYNDN